MTAVLYNPTVVQSLTDTPPVSAAGGDAFLIVATAKGSWAGKENQVAQWSGADWRYFTPATGDSVQQKSSGTFLFFDGTNWVSQAKWVGQEEGGALPLAGGTMTGAIAWALPTNDDGSVIQQVTPKHSGTSVWYQRLGGASFAGVWDPVMQFGFNVGPAGLPVDPTLGTVAMNFEGFYAPADGDDQEWHIIFGTKDGLIQTRILSADADQTTGVANLTCTGSQFSFVDQNGSGGILDIYGLSSVVSEKRVSIGPNVSFHFGDGTTSSSINFNNGSAYVGVGLGDALNLTALNSLPIKLYGTGGAASILARTGMTVGGNGDKATTVPNVTLTPEASQTVPVMAVTSGAGTAVDLIAYGITTGITASTTQTQGQGPLKSEVNVIGTCAHANDTCTLPTLAAAMLGCECVVINKGANTLKLFPASGQDLGAGADTSTTIAAGAFKRFQSISATAWIDAS